MGRALLLHGASMMNDIIGVADAATGFATATAKATAVYIAIAIGTAREGLTNCTVPWPL